MSDTDLKEQARKSYAPDALPEKVTRKLYVRYGIDDCVVGRIVLNESEFSDWYVTIGEVEVTVGIEKFGVDDLKMKVLAVLEGQKQKVLAENHQRIKEVQDKIDNLLALEHKPSEAA